MPSPQSIVHGFYYSHPQNRFWPLLAALFGGSVPKTPEEKADYALNHGIALWDVLAACDIDGASDASIRHPKPNDIAMLLQNAPIGNIYTTGKAAHSLFQRLISPAIGRDAIYLPSTSPANQAAFPWDKLLETWRGILKSHGDL